MSGRLLAADAEADAEEAIDALIVQLDQARGELDRLRAENEQLHAKLNQPILDVIRQRDDARGELTVLRTHLAMDAKHADEHAEKRSSAFWYTMWTEGNRRAAEIAAELERLRAAVAAIDPVDLAEDRLHQIEAVPALLGEGRQAEGEVWAMAREILRRRGKR